MAKQQRRPTPAPQSKKTPAAKPDATRSRLSFWNDVRKQGYVLFALALVLYANSLSHGFLLDDKVVITDNAFTQKGISGLASIFSEDSFAGYMQEVKLFGSRYRPLTIAVFALIHQVFGDTPWPYHLFTVLFFAGTVLLLHRTLLLLLRQQAGGQWIAGLAALLFAVHPVHTEVVNNIKSCDEIAALAGGLGALYLALRAFDSGRRGLAWASGGILLLGMLGKENALTFLAVLPMALWMFRGASGRQLWRYTGPALLFAGVALLIRAIAIGPLAGETSMFLINNPFVKLEDGQWVPFTLQERLATVLYCAGKYLQLLVFPHPLTSDYYPRQIGIMTFGNILVWLSLLVHLALTVFIFRKFRSGRLLPERFGAFYYLVTISIVSNLFFSVGTNMAERFLFMPSVGFCLAAASLLVRFGLQSQQRRNATIGIVVLLAILFSVKTVVRNTAWSSNLTLFATDVKTSANSAKINHAYGGELCEQALNEKDQTKRTQLLVASMQYLNKALEIFPPFPSALYMRGNASYMLNQFELAANDYRETLRLNAAHPRAKNNLALALREAAKALIARQGDPRKIRDYLLEAQKYYDKDPEILYLLGQAYINTGQPAEAIPWFNKLVELQPNNADALKGLMQAYLQAGDAEKAKGVDEQIRAMAPGK